MFHRARTLLVIGLLPILALAQQKPVATQGLKTVNSKYYTLQTTLDPDGVKEANIRITLMAEEYARRTKGFAGSVDRKLPFFLFKDPLEYFAAGGMPNTAGVFMGDRLMAWSDGKDPIWTWHVVQHEGFHQFAHYAIGGDIPIWANEGLAEYFGFGVWTGDDFRTGLIPPKQLATVKKLMKDERFLSIEKMMKTDHEIWNTSVALDPRQAGPNYVQAWSMVYFLAHGDNGKYQAPFSKFLKAVSDKTPWEDAWRKHFGVGVADFEKRWKKYWTELPDEPSLVEYADASVATLTGFYARGLSQRQTFDDFAALRAACEKGEVKMHADDWLPLTLGQQAVKDLPKNAEFTLKRGGTPALVCTLENGTMIEGKFKTNANGRVRDVTTTIKKKPNR